MVNFMNLARVIASFLLLLDLGCVGSPKSDKPSTDAPENQPPLVLMADPGLPAGVYDLIKDEGGADKDISDKNDVIPLIKSAIDRNDSKRDTDIINALAGKPQFVKSGLAARIIALLPPLAPPPPLSLLANPGIPSDIYEAIRDEGGAANDIADKNTALPLVHTAILLGAVAQRDTDLTAALNKFPGLANKILGNMLIMAMP
jgi:hypothetical protein